MKEWTIMVYMAGDNNLNDDMFAGILGLKERLNLSLQSKVSFLVFFDGETLTAKTLQIDFSDRHAGFVTRNSENDRTSISDFVRWCIGDGVNERGHKADNYALIFSGHGDGFLSGKFLRDDNPGSYLTGPDLRSELRKVKEILDGGKLQIVGFDSCVMHSLETAYEMEPFAEILIGSQGYFPNAGWDYGRIANNITKRYDSGVANIPKEELATIFTDSLIESNFRYALYAGRSIDINWTDLSGIDDLASATLSFAADLTSVHEDGHLRGKLEQAILTAHWKCQTFYYDQSIDLVDFCEILKENCDADLNRIATSCDVVTLAADRCVGRHLFLGSEFQYARGISLFFPWSYDTYKQFFEKIYTKLDLAIGDAHIGDEHTFDKSKWAAFLERYLKATKRRVNPKAGNPVPNMEGLRITDKSNRRRPEPLKPFATFTPFEEANLNFLFNAHRVGGGDRPRVGGGDRPRIGGGDRPKGGAVAEEIRITKNLPWVWNEWGLSDEVKDILVKAGIIDASGEPSGFIPV